VDPIFPSSPFFSLHNKSSTSGLSFISPQLIHNKIHKSSYLLSLNTSLYIWSYNKQSQSCCFCWSISIDLELNLKLQTDRQRWWHYNFLSVCNQPAMETRDKILRSGVCESYCISASPPQPPNAHISFLSPHPQTKPSIQSSIKFLLLHGWRHPRNPSSKTWKRNALLLHQC
jgi:hypothetical protein